jgi:hypothetical protein
VVGDACVNGECLGIVKSAMQPGEPNPVYRDGYMVQCTLWNGNRCEEPLIRLNPEHITLQPHCVDGPELLRPLWGAGSDTAHAATVWCWIATGTALYVTQGSALDEERTGWMYTQVLPPEDCLTPDVDKRYSEVTVPGIGARIWSFDNPTYLRTGTWAAIQCFW